MRPLPALGAAFAVALTAASAVAQPQRTPPFAENENHFDLPKLKLTQLHPTAPAIVVTSQGGEAFDRAAVQKGDDAPWRLKAEFKCPGGVGLDGEAQHFAFPGTLTALVLYTIGFPDIRDWGDYYELKDANEGAVEGSIWDIPEADGWVEREESFAVDACNAAAASLRQKNAGMSMRVAMSRVGTIYPYAALPEGQSAVARVKLVGRCRQQWFQRDGAGWSPDPDLNNESETTPLRMRLAVKCDAPLAPPRPASNALSAGFAVTEATLVANPVLSKGACPRDLKFRATFLATGAGDVRYRIRGSDGSLSPIRTARVTSASRMAVEFSRTIGRTEAGGFAPTPPGGRSPSSPGGIATPTSPPDPQGPRIAAPGGSGGGGASSASGSIAVATAEGEHSGWLRVEIVSPSGGVMKSREAPYKVICAAPPVPPKGLTIRRPRPN